MDTQKIIDEKEEIIKEIDKVTKEYIKKNVEYKKAKNSAWLDTDFKDVLNSNRPTVDEKKAYVSSQTIDLREERDELWYQREHLLRKLDLCDDKYMADYE